MLSRYLAFHDLSGNGRFANLVPGFKSIPSVGGVAYQLPEYGIKLQFHPDIPCLPDVDTFRGVK